MPCHATTELYRQDMVVEMQMSIQAYMLKE